MDSICNNYKENKHLRKRRDKARVMFGSFCDAPTAHDKSQKEGSGKGVPAISEYQDFNSVVIKGAVTELHNAHMEFAKLHPNQNQRRTPLGLYSAPGLYLVS